VRGSEKTTPLVQMFIQDAPTLLARADEVRLTTASRIFALGPSAALTHRHVGVGKDVGHDAARAYQ
jgi:hypothetical protein